jgi:hypothetical protein
MSQHARPGTPLPVTALILEEFGVSVLKIDDDCVDDTNKCMEFVRQHLGYDRLESGIWPVDFHGPTKLYLNVFRNERGRYENDLNSGASEILGSDLYGNAAFMCCEENNDEDEGEGGEGGEGGWWKVLAPDVFRRKIMERGRRLPEYADKIVPGYWGDMLFNLSTNGDFLLEEPEVLEVPEVPGPA